MSLLSPLYVRAHLPLAPFLYPALVQSTRKRRHTNSRCRQASTSAATAQPPGQHSSLSSSHLDPPAADYSRSFFTDHCALHLHAGAGGHGCVSFHRDKFIAAGPANGGDGGTGGSIYIQAVRGETSLHKLSRHTHQKAGRGRNGRGGGKGGQRGNDVLIQVPVGTVVRETARLDPLVQEEQRRKIAAEEDRVEEEQQGEKMSESNQSGQAKDQRYKWRSDRWILYPDGLPRWMTTADFPALPRPRRSNLTAAQIPAPIHLDLSEPMEKPVLLAAGTMGGLGNPHFVTKSIPKPKFATKGEAGLQLSLELELKLLADVGLVGLPNAGKSTLLRSLSRSRTRVGNWAFTTLRPNIGTVILDDYSGRPIIESRYKDGLPRTQFTIADIPGLVEDAHLDKGLGLGFLRHIERARMLAFVVDLSAGNAVNAVRGLWKELREYEALRGTECRESHAQLVDWSPFGDAGRGNQIQQHASLGVSSISSKPWFVVATKADLPETQSNYEALAAYLGSLDGAPSRNSSDITSQPRGQVSAIPVSAINGEGVNRIVELTVRLLNE